MTLPGVSIADGELRVVSGEWAAADAPLALPLTGLEPPAPTPVPPRTADDGTIKCSSGISLQARQNTVNRSQRYRSACNP